MLCLDIDEVLSTWEGAGCGSIFTVPEDTSDLLCSDRLFHHWDDVDAEKHLDLSAVHASFTLCKPVMVPHIDIVPFLMQPDSPRMSCPTADGMLVPQAPGAPAASNCKQHPLPHSFDGPQSAPLPRLPHHCADVAEGPHSTPLFPFNQQPPASPLPGFQVQPVHYQQGLMGGDGLMETVFPVSSHHLQQQQPLRGSGMQLDYMRDQVVPLPSTPAPPRSAGLRPSAYAGEDCDAPPPKQRKVCAPNVQCPQQSSSSSASTELGAVVPDAAAAMPMPAFDMQCQCTPARAASAPLQGGVTSPNNSGAIFGQRCNSCVVPPSLSCGPAHPAAACMDGALKQELCVDSPTGITAQQLASRLSLGPGSQHVLAPPPPPPCSKSSSASPASSSGTLAPTCVSPPLDMMSMGMPMLAPPLFGRPQFLAMPVEWVQNRLQALERYRHKRARRAYTKKIRYQLRKINADRRPRIKGRFVKKEEMHLYPHLLKHANQDTSSPATKTKAPQHHQAAAAGTRGKAQRQMDMHTAAAGGMHDMLLHEDMDFPALGAYADMCLGEIPADVVDVDLESVDLEGMEDCLWA